MNKPSTILAKKEAANRGSKTLPNVYIDSRHTLEEETESGDDEKSWYDQWDYSHLGHSDYDLDY